MALPNSRNTTYNGEEPILAADLNDIQDWIVNIYTGGKRGDRTNTVPPIAGQFTNATFDEPNGRTNSSSAPWSIAIPMPVQDGDRIKSITMARFGTGGTNQMTMRLYRITPGGSRTQVQSQAITNPAASWGDTIMTLLTPETVSGGASYYMFIDGAQTSQRTNCWRWVSDRP